MCPSIIVNTQVNASNIISWDKKLKLDTWYVNNQSLCLDIKILCKTVKK
ncbi:sugar transferase [uncultured Psychrobacter sp.]|nr:sugar transferase [uncultured Psychrobacter sp.]